MKTFIFITQGRGKPLLHSPGEGDQHHYWRVTTQPNDTRGAPSDVAGPGDAYRVLRAGRASPASLEGLWKAESTGLATSHTFPFRSRALRVLPPFPNNWENSRLYILNTTFFFFPPP